MCMADTNESDHNAGWTTDLESYVLNIQIKCIEFRNIHEQAAIYYERSYHYFTLFLILLSLVSSILSTLDIFLLEIYYKYTLTILALIQTTFVTINKFLGYQELYTQHRLGSQRFLELNQNITQEMLAPANKRQQGLKYIKHIGKVFTDIRNGLPYISKEFLKKLQTTEANPDISFEDVLKKNHNVPHFDSENEDENQLTNVETDNLSPLENYNIKRFKSHQLNFET